MEVTKEVVRRFLENRSSRQETEIVLEYFRKYPEMLDEYLDEKEWDLFIAGELPEEISASWYNNLKQRKEPIMNKVRFIRLAGVAASIIVFVAGFALYSNYSTHKTEQVGKTSAVIIPKEQEIVVSNKSDKAMECDLEDGSRVKLFPKSSLRYLQPLESDKRSIHLKGEAIFYVAKDPKRPFTVYTSSFATTALGTVFRITAYEYQTSSSVVLISGRVVVKNSKDSSDKVYLKAGERCTIDNKSNRLTQEVKAISKKAKAAHIPDKGSMKEIDQEILFYNSPLPEVFQALSKAYAVPIQFTYDDVKNRSFTGSCKKDQTLEKEIQAIIELNDLTVKKINDTLRVSRK